MHQSNTLFSAGSMTVIVTWMITCGCLVLATGSALGYPDYGGCSGCHPGYINRGPLHDLHVGNNQMTNNCLLCHTNVGDTPRTWTSGDPEGQGCRGCHGVDNGTAFQWAAGLRKHHVDSGIGVCSGCHSDSPSSLRPESTEPVYFLRPDVNVNDPCLTATPGGEDWDGDGQGLDNDGDLAYDQDDPDCSGVGISEAEATSPRLLSILSIAPNPMLSSGTEIHYGVAETSEVTVKVYDVGGHMILERRFAGVTIGEHSFRFDGRDETGRPLASGVYVIRIEAGTSVATGRVVLLN